MRSKKVSKHQANLANQVIPSISDKSINTSRKEKKMTKKNQTATRNVESVNDDAPTIANTSESADPPDFVIFNAAQEVLTSSRTSAQTFFRKVSYACSVTKRQYEKADRKRTDARNAYFKARAACRKKGVFPDECASVVKAFDDYSRACDECSGLIHVYCAIKPVYDAIMRAGRAAIKKTK